MPAECFILCGLYPGWEVKWSHQMAPIPVPRSLPTQPLSQFRSHYFGFLGFRRGGYHLVIVWYLLYDGYVWQCLSCSPWDSFELCYLLGSSSQMHDAAKIALERAGRGKWRWDLIRHFCVILFSLLLFIWKRQGKTYIQIWGSAIWYVGSAVVRDGIKVTRRRMLVIRVL